MIDLVRSVSQFNRDHDAGRLIEHLKNQFSPFESLLICLAVVVTRGAEFDPLNHLPEQRTSADALTSFIDCVSVTFVFNIVNRLANFYGLTPEWLLPREGRIVATWRQSLMAFGVSQQMRINMPQSQGNDETDPRRLECIEQLLLRMGGMTLSRTWKLLKCIPAVETAIFQFVSVVANNSRSDEVSLMQATQAAQGDFGEPNVGPEAAAHALWRCLYDEPYRLRTKDSECLLFDTGSLIDHVLRVTVLAAANRINSVSIERLADRLGG